MSPRFTLGRLAAQSDTRLAELVASGHERAFEVLVKRYRPELLRFCARTGLPDSRAEDVLQHAFLQAWMTLRGGKEIRELRPWLYRVVHNAAVNAMRSASREASPPAGVTELHKTEGAEWDLERGMTLRAALTDVAALPRMQRDAILLTAVEGRSHEEVASALGISHGAVRGLLYRARATLRSAAAAVIPQPLISWAYGSIGRVNATIERLTPAGSGSGVLLKGAAVAATAVLVVGATVAPLHGHGGHGRSSSHAKPALSKASAMAGAPAAHAQPSAGAHLALSTPLTVAGRRLTAGTAHTSSGSQPSVPVTRVGSAPAPSVHALLPAAGGSTSRPVTAIQVSSSATSAVASQPAQGGSSPPGGAGQGLVPVQEVSGAQPVSGGGSSGGSGSGSGGSGGSDGPGSSEAGGGSGSEHHGSDGSGGESDDEAEASREHAASPETKSEAEPDH